MEYILHMNDAVRRLGQNYKTGLLVIPGVGSDDVTFRKGSATEAIFRKHNIIIAPRRIFKLPVSERVGRRDDRCARKRDSDPGVGRWNRRTSGILERYITRERRIID